jgi:hypothetical protein
MSFGRRKRASALTVALAVVAFAFAAAGLGVPPRKGCRLTTVSPFDVDTCGNVDVDWVSNRR